MAEPIGYLEVNITLYNTHHIDLLKLFDESRNFIKQHITIRNSHPNILLFVVSKCQLIFTRRYCQKTFSLK